MLVDDASTATFLSMSLGRLGPEPPDGTNHNG